MPFCKGKLFPEILFSVYISEEMIFRSNIFRNKEYISKTHMQGFASIFNYVFNNRVVTLIILDVLSRSPERNVVLRIFKTSSPQFLLPALVTFRNRFAASKIQLFAIYISNYQQTVRPHMPAVEPTETQIYMASGRLRVT